MLVAPALLMGCAEPTTGRVSGVVTVDGASAETGSIALFPLNGAGTTAGAAIKQGKYEAVVKLGQYKVEIRVPRIIGKVKVYETANSPMKNVMEESLPPKYNDQTELQVEIKPGENLHDFNLKRK